MKTYHNLILASLLVLACTTAFSQTPEEKKAILNRGIALNDSGKYDEAIAKYRELIKLDSNYTNAYYETGYTYFSSGRGKDAIPFLSKALALRPDFAACYDMLGSIYDDMKEPEKAIDYYNRGLKADSTYQRLHFNLAISYYRTGKYSEAEASIIKAIKLDATHASSQRVLGMVAYAEKKRGVSLLAWSDFLLLEPDSKRSPEALKYLMTVLNYGISNRTQKSVNITIGESDPPENMIMQLSVTTATDNKKNLSAVDSLQLELTSLYELGTAMTGEKANPVIKNYYADYFSKLAKSGNMPAFVHYITLSAYRDEDLAWFKDHNKELKDLQAWIRDTKRDF